MAVWQSEDERLWDQEQDHTERKQRIDWGVLHPEDKWVRNTFTTERGARFYVERHPEAVLVRQVVDIETTETFNDWEIQP